MDFVYNALITVHTIIHDFSRKSLTGNWPPVTGSVLPAVLSQLNQTGSITNSGQHAPRATIHPAWFYLNANFTELVIFNILPTWVIEDRQRRHQTGEKRHARHSSVREFEKFVKPGSSGTLVLNVKLDFILTSNCGKCKNWSMQAHSKLLKWFAFVLANKIVNLLIMFFKKLQLLI